MKTPKEDEKKIKQRLTTLIRKKKFKKSLLYTCLHYQKQSVKRKWFIGPDFLCFVCANISQVFFTVGD